jgi:phosphatidate phosphatase APP1
MQTATRPLTSLWTTVRTQLRDSRDAHAARVSLERELAGYNSQSDLDDLHAILDRYSEQETKQIRRILAYQSSR